MQQAVEEQYEGIVIKDCNSVWSPNGRTNSWIKFKPDYLPTEDLDCLVVGGFYGTGSRGGTVAQWILAIADRPTACATEPTQFLTFCKVSDETLHRKTVNC